MHKKWKRYYKFGVPLFVCLCLTFMALQGVERSGKDPNKDSTSGPTPKRQERVSAEADSLLVRSSEYIRKGEFTAALNAATLSLELNEAIGNQRSIGNSHNKIATIYYYKGAFFEALAYFEKSIVAYQKANFLRGVASSTNNKGAIFNSAGTCAGVSISTLLLLLSLNFSREI